MTRLVAIRLLLVALVSAAWLLPLIRAVRLLSLAISVDNGSINAANDTQYGSSLVISYGFSFVVALVIAWVLPGRGALLLLLPVTASLFVAADVIRLAPESLIVLFPTMDAFRPATFSVFIGAAGALIVWFCRTKRLHRMPP